MEKLSRLLEKWNIEISHDQLVQFRDYYNLLLEWNSFMNLTTITDHDEVLLKHFVDSISLGYYFPLSDQCLLDLGTGAGFPGIPLKILYPDLDVVLVDSLNKRIKFLDEVINTLELKKIKTIHSRAEDIGHNNVYRETFDICTSRAVANLSTLSEYCLPMVKKNGWFIPYKSEKTQEEISDAEYAIDILGGKIDHVEEFSLPDSELNRTLIFIKKIGNTSSKYPRKAGTPSKEPLKR